MILRFASLLSLVLAMQFLRSGGYSYFKPMLYGEGECIDDDWYSHPIGSIWYDNKKCEKLHCVFNGEILFEKGFGCSTIGVPAGCQLVPGRGISYPSCCPQVECENGMIW